MFGFDDTSCDSSDALCNAVYGWTDNQKLANASDIIIGKPLAIAWLVILFFIVRWLLHRVVDRLVARAEDGMLPSGVGRFGLRGKSTASPSAQDLAS